MASRLFQHEEFTKKIKEKTTILGTVFCKDKGQNLWKPAQGNWWITNNSLNKHAFTHKENVMPE